MAAATPHQGTSAPIILTPGDPAGIGAEISRKAFAAGLRGFILMEDPDRLAAMAARLGLDIPIKTVEAPFNLAPDHAALPVLALSWDTAPVPGTGDPRNAACVIESIRRAAGMAQDGQLLYALGQELANAETWPEWKAGSEFKAARDASAAARK